VFRNTDGYVPGWRRTLNQEINPFWLPLLDLVACIWFRSSSWLVSSQPLIQRQYSTSYLPCSSSTRRDDTSRPLSPSPHITHHFSTQQVICSPGLLQGKGHSFYKSSSRKFADQCHCQEREICVVRQANKRTVIFTTICVWSIEGWVEKMFKTPSVGSNLSAKSERLPLTWCVQVECGVVWWQGHLCLGAI